MINKPYEPLNAICRKNTGEKVALDQNATGVAASYMPRKTPAVHTGTRQKES